MYHVVIPVKAARLHEVRALVLVAIAACGGSKAPARDPADVDDTEESPDGDGEPRGTPFADCDPSLGLTDDPARVLLALDYESQASRGADYSLVVFRDGLVQYVGRYAVLTCEGSSRLEPAQLAELERMFDEADFLTFADEYTSYHSTHAAMITLTYAPTPTRVKRVKHYRGDRQAPLGLRALEDDLDQLLYIDQFIGTQRERDAARRAR